MHAVRIVAPNHSELAVVERPVPATGEVLVKVAAAGSPSTAPVVWMYSSIRPGRTVNPLIHPISWFGTRSGRLVVEEG